MATTKIKRLSALVMILAISILLAACGDPLATLTFALLDGGGNDIVFNYDVDTNKSVITAYVGNNTRLQGVNYKPIIEVPEDYVVLYNGKAHENYVSAYEFNEPLKLEIGTDGEMQNWEIIIKQANPPIVYWTFDNGLPNEITPVNKASIVNGLINDGVLLEGFKGKGYLEVDADFVAKNLVFPNNRFSIDLWFLADSEYLTNGWNALFSTGGNARGNVRILLGGHPEGLAQKLAYIAVDNSVGEAPIGWELNRWHHIALVCNGEDILVYLDGELAVRRPNAGVETVDFQANLPEFFIGAESPTFRYFGGLVDEVRIWDYALSESQVKEAALVF